MNGAGQWVKYQELKDDTLRAETVSRYLPLVRRQAAKLALGLPAHVSREDLVQAGLLGLLEALRRYDAARGVKFEVYAAGRIRGAMLDELRRLCWLPRSLTRQMRELDKASQELAARLGREPEADELAAFMGVPPAQLQKMLQEINCASLLSLEETLFAGGITDPEEDGLEQMIAGEEKERLAAAIASLPERQQQLLALYYQEEMTLKEIGLVFQVSESRVCQLHARAIAGLRAALSV